MDRGSETQPQVVEILNKLTCRISVTCLVILFEFQLLEAVFRYCDPQLQVTENYSDLFNLATILVF